ncbi:hypothetical protein C8Q78DRAFT_487425 [Trametes maxima]|nr:hypothetical protein C8Q78DRAFT_487425 [Trametes maxima]
MCGCECERGYECGSPYPCPALYTPNSDSEAGVIPGRPSAHAGRAHLGSDSMMSEPRAGRVPVCALRPRTSRASAGRRVVPDAHGGRWCGGKIGVCGRTLGRAQRWEEKTRCPGGRDALAGEDAVRLELKLPTDGAACVSVVFAGSASVRADADSRAAGDRGVTVGVVLPVKAAAREVRRSRRLAARRAARNAAPSLSQQLKALKYGESGGRRANRTLLELHSERKQAVGS